MLKKHQNLKNFRLPCHFLVHLSLSLLRVTALNRKAKSGQKNRYYVAVAQRFNLLFLLHFLIFYVRKVRIVNDKTKINFGKCA